jgi:hypothetical protein
MASRAILQAFIMAAMAGSGGCRRYCAVNPPSMGSVAP